MTNELAAYIAKISKLHGRAAEIAKRIREDARLLDEVQRELAVNLEQLWQLHNEAPPPVVSPRTEPRILRLTEVLERVGLGRSSVWRMVKEERFPAPRRLSTKAIGWLDKEIDDWLKARRGTTDSPKHASEKTKRQAIDRRVVTSTPPRNQSTRHASGNVAAQPADFSDPESQRVLAAAAHALAGELGREAGREYFAKLIGKPKASK